MLPSNEGYAQIMANTKDKDTKILIKGGRVIDPSYGDSPGKGIDAKMDLRVKDGRIAEVGESLQPNLDEMIFDAAGLWVLPGFVDIHTHLRDLGQSDREDVGTGTLAAACGGYTTVVAMANSDPPMDSSAILGRLLQHISERACIEVLPAACVTKGMAGQELTNMVELAEMGVIAFSDDGLPVANLGVLRRALEYSRLANRVIISHAEDRDLSCGGCVHESVVATRLGLPGIPGASESACVAREIEVTREAGARIHFAHISTAASVQLIRNAKKQGLSITADVTPHHLTLTDEDIKDYDTSYKMNPPLRTRKDQEALIEGLKDGALDAVATDHAPHSRQDKSKPFDQAPFGVIGLETAFPLCLDRLMRQAGMTPLELVALFTQRPASIIGRSCTVARPGHRANLSVFNPDLAWVYDVAKSLSKSRNSPFHGRQLQGKNLMTLFEGRIVYSDAGHIGKRLKEPASASR